MDKQATAALAAPPRAAPVGAARGVLLVFGCAVGMLVGFSATYFSTLSVFLKPIAHSFGWGRAEISAIVTLAQLGLAIGSPITGRLISRFGVCAVVLASTVLYALSLLALSMASGHAVIFAGLTLWLGLIAVGTTPMGYLSAMPVMFDKRLGLAMGLAMIGLGAGNAMMPLLVQGWIAASGWQAAYRYVAAAVLIVGLIAYFLLASVRIPRPEHKVPARSAAGSRSRKDAYALMRTWRFVVLTLVFFAVSSAGLGAIIHMVPMLTDAGLPAAQAAKIAALIGIGVLAGRAVTGILIDVIDARYVAAVQFVLGGAGLVLIVMAPATSTALVGLGAFTFAFVIGAEGDFMPFFIRRYFGVEPFSFLYGVQFFFFALGGVSGPIVFGWVFDRFHHYALAYGGAGVLCAICGVLVMTMGKYAYPVER